MRVHIITIKLALLFFFIGILLILIPQVHEAPANPAPFNVTQPDGTVLVVRLIGDERGSGVITINGSYSIERDNDGYWRYIDSYTGNLTGRAGIDMPVSTDNKYLFIHRPPLPSPLPPSGYLDNVEKLAGIVGIVSNHQGVSICYAKVTLYHCVYDAKTGNYVNTDMVDNPANPQLTRDGRFSERGIYAFPYLQSGLYNVTVEKESLTSEVCYTIVYLDAKRGTATANILYDVSIGLEANPPARLYFPKEDISSDKII